MQSSWWWRLAVLGTALFVLVTMFGKLDARPVQNWDESIHAAVSHESLERGSWFDLWYRDGHYFRKPPLKFWVTSGLFATVGENLWTVRFWSALAGVATTVLLAWWSWQLWRNRWQALLTALVFASGRFVFFHSFRTGETDGLLIFFVSLALYAYWRSWKESRWLLLTGLATGFAVMTKSAGGLLPGVIIAVDLLVARRWPFQWRHVFSALGIFAVVTVPWHAVELIRHGSSFWNDYIGTHVLDRATEQIHNQGIQWWWYGKIFLERFFPWSFWLPAAGVAALIALRRDRQSPGRLLVVWFVVTFVFFSVAATKFDWYILPLYPAAALLLTPWLATIFRPHTGRVLASHVVTFFAFLLYLPLALHPDTALRWLYPFSRLVETRPTLLYATLMAMVLAVYILLMTRNRPRWLPRATGIYAGAKLLVLATAFTLLTIRAESPASSPLPALRQAIESTKATTLYTRGIDLLNYPAAYYYFRTIPGVRLIDLEKQSAPASFGPADAVLVRDPVEPLPELEETLRVQDFRLFRAVEN